MGSNVKNTTGGNFVAAKEEGKNKPLFQDMINDSELENCNINLKPNNPKTNRPNSRKRSAFKFIEDNLEKEKTTTNETNKDININPGGQSVGGFNKNANETNQSGFMKDNKNKIDNSLKPKIIAESNMNKFLQNVNNDSNNTEKKIEYESRRKKPMSFINGMDNFSGSGVGDKNNSSKGGSSQNVIKPEINLTSGSGYESRRQMNFHKNKSVPDKDNENNFGGNKNLSKI